jgi:tetratricopeptide (TPR) repeat protein
MYKIVFSFLLLGLIFSGCISSTPEPEPKRANQKSFDQEDALILFALRAEQVRENKTAASIFYKIYQKSDKREYLYRSLQNSLIAKENKKVIEEIDKISTNDTDDFVLIRLKIIALSQLQLLDEAQSLAIDLVEKSRAVDDYILVSDIYVAQGKFDIAVKYLESAYLNDYNEKILDKMAIVLYLNLNRKKDAIAQLETHTRVHGCSALICRRLISFYSNENSVDGLLSVYLRYYNFNPSDDIAKKIVQIYTYKKDYIQLVFFLEKSKSDDKTLLEAYSFLKDYEKAQKLSKKLYERTGDIKYLGENVIYQYENQKDKNDKKFLKEISRKFEEVLAQDERSLYLNYYGYILIDHEIDIQKGMGYIKKALDVNPKSAYYLDSLAWGYYKLGECKKALKTIKEVMTLKGGDDPEVIKHYKIIKKCKGKKRR